MKTFASIASRRRIFITIVQTGGLILSAITVFWLALVLHKTSPYRNVMSAIHSNGNVPPQSDNQEQLLAFVNRPLRPPMPPAVTVATSVPAVPKPIKIPELELVATMLNPGQTPRAFVRSKVAGKLVSVQSGKQIDGATVKDISEGQVTLDIEGHEVTLKVGKKPS